MQVTRLRWVMRLGGGKRQTDRTVLLRGSVRRVVSLFTDGAMEQQASMPLLVCPRSVVPWALSPLTVAQILRWCPPLASS